ncbi:MAG: tetratricopeptide repeat protein [Nitrospirota bacterium]|nr:tetratricopeptide repeat protein [Nitrospirota bacterium]
MGRFYFILFIGFLGVIGYLAILNPGSVDITVARNDVYRVTTVGLILLSAASGALFVLFGVLVKDTSRYFLEWQVIRKEKQKAKIQELYSKGIDALFGLKYAQAETYFKKVLALDPNHIEALLRLGNCCLRQGNHSEAIRLYQKARNLDDHNIEILFALEAGQEETKRVEEALQTLDSILSIDQSNLTALFRKRDILLRQKQWAKALETQEQIIKAPLPIEDKPLEQRRLLGLRYEYGRALLEDGTPKGAEKAEKAFSAIIKADKDFVPAYLGLGEIFLTQEQPSEAESLWVSALKTTGSVIFLHRLEDFYLRQGEPEKIINLYQEAINREPDNTTMKFFLGKIYYRLEMLDDAFDVLNSIDTSTKPLPLVHLIIGNIYQRRDRLADAANEYRKALKAGEQPGIPYTCSNCDYPDTEWSGRCPQCGRWNTYTVNIHLLKGSERQYVGGGARPSMLTSCCSPLSESLP